MNNPSSSKILLTGLALLAVSSASAETPFAFRGEAPVGRSAITAPETTEGVSFRDNNDVAVRSAVAVSAAGVSNGEFVPTSNLGPVNSEKRPYHFTFSLSQGYDDNIYTSSFDEQESLFTSASVGVTLDVGNGQTSLKVGLSAGGAYYWDREDSFDPDIALNVDLSHVFSPKLRLDIASYLSYQAEPDFSVGFGQTRRNGDYFYGSVSFSLSQTITRRFSIIYGYSIAGVYYNESEIADTENRLEQNFSLQLRYLIQPTVAAVAEYRFGITTYDSINRDSTSNYALAGLDFTLNRRLTASIRAGAQFRDSDDDGTATSPFLESTLSYKYGERSSIQWLNRYGFEESDYGIGSTSQTYRTGLTVNQQLTSRITANGGVFYSNSEYDNSFGQDEQTLDLTLGLVYSVNRLLSFQAGYTYTKVYSDNIFREYDRNRLYMGATLSF